MTVFGNRVLEREQCNRVWEQGARERTVCLCLGTGCWGEDSVTVFGNMVLEKVQCDCAWEQCAEERTV